MTTKQERSNRVCVHMTSRRPCWRSKLRNGGHVEGVKYSFGDWTLFLCKFLLLFHHANMASSHMSEHTLLKFYGCFCGFSSTWKEPNQIQRGWFRKHVRILQDESPNCLSLPLRNCAACPEPAELFSMRSAGYWRSFFERRRFEPNFLGYTRWSEWCNSCGLFGWCRCSQTVSACSTISWSKTPQHFLVWGAGRWDKPYWDVLWVTFQNPDQNGVRYKRCCQNSEASHV